MWWSDGRALALRVAALALPLALAGCFQPEYAATTVVTPSGVPVTVSLTDRLRAVQVEPIAGRVGQQVRNTLLFAFTGGGEAAPPRYVLSMTVTSTDTQAIVDVPTYEPDVDTVVVEGRFALTRVGDPHPILTGVNFGRKSYDRTLQRFASVRAARDAENSAAELLADEVRTRVAAYLSGPA